MADELKQIKFRRGTSAAWAAAGTVLAEGEPGFDTTLRRVKVGDGVSGWATLPWVSSSAADIARLEAAAASLEGATTPTDAAMATVAGTPGSAFGGILENKIADVAGLLTKAGEAYWAERFAQPATYDRPTITTATASQISGGTAVAPVADYFGDPKFRYNGCPDVTATGFGVLSAVGTLVPETVTDATDIEFKFRDGRTGDIGIRVIVNGKMMQVRMLRVSGTSGNTRHVRLQFPDARIRHIQVEHDGFNAFGGVVIGANTVHRRPTREWRARYVGIGDSLLQGLWTYDYLRYESFDRLFAFALGMDFYMNLGAGGSGFVNPAGAANPFSARVPAALSVSPHVLSFMGSRNDVTYLATLRQAVLDTVAMATDVPIVYVAGSAQAGFSSLSELNRQGALGAGRTYLDIDALAAAGVAGPPLEGHPSYAEMITVAKAAYAQVDRTLVDARIEGVNTAKSGPTLALTTSSASPAVGASVTFTATLSGSYAGSVQFYDGTAILGTSTVAAGVATYATNSLSVAAHLISARFIPADPFAVRSATSNSVTVTVSANIGFADDFNRADGPLGDTLNGKPWTVVGSWAIASNKCKSASSGFATVDAGTPDVDISWTISGGTANASNPVIRYQDGGNYLHINGNGIYEIVANGASTLLVAFTPTGFAAGDVIRVVAQGNTITVRKNGTIIGTVTTTRFNTATRFGMRGGGASTDTYYDDVTCVAA
ncbi:Ig-like domain repeat protein [Microbacterium sp. A1-JK]|uniref:hyaluronate lyase N-terminal domain-containing protein n=1 Tax=Microbacterium sp. A1-JK TaxID=3177516 RepID=UPI00388974F5